MVIPDSSRLRVAGLDGSAYGNFDFGRFVENWGAALNRTRSEVSRAPDRPGLVRSIADLVSAIFRTVAGASGGVVEGVVNGL